MIRLRLNPSPLRLLFLLALGSAFVGCSQPLPRPADCILRIGTSGDYPPFSRRSATGEYEGLDIEMGARLATDFGCRPTFVPFGWPELLAQLESGAIDVAMSGVTLRWDRALVGRYSRPYAFSGAVAVVRAAIASPGSLEELDRAGVRVAVNRGGHLERVARQRLPRADLQLLDNNLLLLPQLFSDTVNAVVSDSAEAATWPATEIHVLGPFTHDAKAFLLPEASADLARRIDDWLVAREVDGWLASARARWLGPPGLDAMEVARRSVAALVQLRLALMPSVAAAKRASGLPVVDEGQEKRVLERVGTSVRTSSDHAVAIYRELIEMAKAVQRTNIADLAIISLPKLRDAIARIDEQLLREIEREPSGGPVVWRQAVDDFVVEPGVDATMRNRLVRLLVTDSASSH